MAPVLCRMVTSGIYGGSMRNIVGVLMITRYAPPPEIDSLTYHQITPLPYRPK